jgi:hypothetical protein
MTSRFFLASSLALGVLTASSSALADETPQKTDTPAEKEDRRVYLSLSPVHLLLAMGEVTGEVRVHRKIGVAGIAGFGKPKDGATDTRYTAWELGGQVVTYPVGHFDHGMQLGVEALYAGVAGDTSVGNTRISSSAQGFAVGPMVGYKLATDVGFSFNVQGGIAYFASAAEASGGGTSATASTSPRAIPILNLNLGWSF